MDDRGVAPPEEVRQVFGPGIDRAVQVEPVAHVLVASATTGIWRVRHGARSAVLKVLAHGRDGHENWRSGAAPDHWYYWRREAAAYESGLLGSLVGGLRAPDCYLVAPRADGSVALWLEDLRGAPGASWSIGRYEVAARHLGRAQGEFVMGRALPDDPWLSRGWLRDYLGQRDRDRELLDDRAAWGHPLVRAWFPEPPIDDLVALRDHQDHYLRVLDRLPRTVCHLDLHPANLFAGDGDGDGDGDGEGDTAVVDWAFVGIGALGEDAGNLVPDAALDFHVAPALLDDLYGAVARGYHAGLCDAGWGGTAEEVRRAMATTMVAKYAWIPAAMLRATSADRAQLNRHPLAPAVDAWAPTVRFLLDRAREVADLSGLRRG